MAAPNGFRLAALDFRGLDGRAMRALFSRLVITILLLGFAAAAPAVSAPRSLTYADANLFREILSPTLSRDGQWLATIELPQEGDGEVVVRHLDDSRVWRAPVGATPPLPFPRATSPDEKRPTPTRATVSFTGDSRFLVVHALPAAAAQAAARESPGAEKPLRPLVILNLATGETTVVERVKSVQVPARGPAIIAYLVAETKTEPAGNNGAEEDAEKSAPLGDILVLHDLAAKTRHDFAHTTEYTLARDGRTLVYAIAAVADAPAALFALDPVADTPALTLYTGPTSIKKLTWDREQTQLAFLCEDVADPTVPIRRIEWWRRHETNASILVDQTTAGVPSGMLVSDKASLAFTHDGRRLLLGVAPVRPKFDPPKDPEDRVNADIWSWQDDLIQPRQEVRAKLDREESYRGMIDLASRRYVQIGTPEIPDVLITDDGTRALAIDHRPYYRLRDFDGTYGDVHLLDLTTGERRQVLTKLRGSSGDEGDVSLQLSPDGKWAAYYADKHWHVLDLDRGTGRPLTAGLPVPLYNEDHDQPEPAPAYGWAGWVEDSASCLVYDRYDLWRVFPDGRAPQNLTAGHGRAHRLILRRQDFSPREEDDPRRGVALGDTMIVRAEDERTRSTGFLRFSAGTAAPETLLWGEASHNYVGRALAADRLLLTVSRFDQFPDVWLTDENLAAPRRITDGQAQLAPFKWGRAELIDYTNSAGVPLQACVYLPADFDPTKKYPLIVYTYERLARIIHQFFVPAPGSNISFPVYASNGYIVMLADLAYNVGHPGPSALDCVHAALDAIIARGFVDENAIGFQGSSWGGYTAAYLITHSNRFAAAAAGSPVGNMTSAYAGIRATSGQPRLFQYEQSQSRIGQPLTTAPELYLENSPVFHAHNAAAPLLIMHNDRDGAVPFSQGVELFLALRRHAKPAWLINYRNEGHGLDREANRRDYSRRMWQYFDHYLRGAPAPAWLTDGVPFLDRDAEKQRFNGE